MHQNQALAVIMAISVRLALDLPAEMAFKPGTERIKRH